MYHTRFGAPLLRNYCSNRCLTVTRHRAKLEILNGKKEFQWHFVQGATSPPIASDRVEEFKRMVINRSTVSCITESERQRSPNFNLTGSMSPAKSDLSSEFGFSKLIWSFVDK